MHVISILQDEETPQGKIKFNGEVNASNKNRSMAQIYQEYYESYPSCIDRIFTGINRSVVRCGACKYDSVTFKPFSVLPLEPESTLDSAIKEYL